MVLVRALYVTFPEKPVTILIIIRQRLVNLPMLVKSIDIAGRLSPRNGSNSVLPPCLFTMTCVRKFTNVIDNIDTYRENSRMQGNKSQRPPFENACNSYGIFSGRDVWPIFPSIVSHIDNVSNCGRYDFVKALCRRLIRVIIIYPFPHPSPSLLPIPPIIHTTLICK